MRTVLTTLSAAALLVLVGCHCQQCDSAPREPASTESTSASEEAESCCETSCCEPAGRGELLRKAAKQAGD